MQQHLKNDSSNDPVSPLASSLPQDALDYIMEECLKNEYSLVSAEEAKSAQHRVVIIQVEKTFHEMSNSDATITAVDEKWMDCLKKGRNRLVVRIWKGGSNWWNLNRNQDPVEIARREIRGYQMAHQAFQQRQHQHQQAPDITIPRLLRYQLTAKETLPDRHSCCCCCCCCCWAVLEYVGLHSTLFDDDKKMPVSSYVDGMIKVRHEFGFDEPHPRWGRVPIDQCLDYATMILNEVVLPMQQHTKRKIAHDNKDDDEDLDIMKPQNYATMVEKYQTIIQEIWSSSRQNDNNYAVMMPRTNDDDHDEERMMMNALEKVQEAVTRILPQHLVSKTIPPMAPVLVHLDLQPQNLLFYKNAKDDNKSSSSSTTTLPSSSNNIHVSSVLDWEDAALADPRLEVLLMCRKVCANRLQANTLWSLFEQQQQQQQKAAAPAADSSINEEADDDDSIIISMISIGPILPWLQLECIHSILTLLLQSMDLLNGGRNPWETKKDLWNKLQRELQRWDSLIVE